MRIRFNNLKNCFLSHQVLATCELPCCCTPIAHLWLALFRRVSGWVRTVCGANLCSSCCPRSPPPRSAFSENTKAASHQVVDPYRFVNRKLLVSWLFFLSWDAFWMHTLCSILGHPSQNYSSCLNSVDWKFRRLEFWWLKLNTGVRDPQWLAE